MLTYMYIVEAAGVTRDLISSSCNRLISFFRAATSPAAPLVARMVLVLASKFCSILISWMLATTLFWMFLVLDNHNFFELEM